MMPGWMPWRNQGASVGPMPQRRREYHEWMDAKAAVRAAMEKERKAGHWADPLKADDPHDEHGLENYEA